MGNGESSYRRFLAGDNEGMLEIVCEYQTELMLYLNSYVQDIHMAEDLAEDTFLELMLKRPKFSGKSSFKTWLFAIGRNITVKHLRKHAKLSVVPLESQEYLAVEDDIEDNYIKTEQKKMVHQALHQLKLEYRQVLFLNYFEGFSISEIALIMNKSEKQIKNYLYKAKNALRSELERRGFDYEES
mgnify:FL=1